MSSSPRKAFKNPRARHNYQGRPCSIVGVGSYVPARVLANAELERMVEIPVASLEVHIDGVRGR